MEAKTVDGRTTVTMTDTEADELFYELGDTSKVTDDAETNLFLALLEDGREIDVYS